jgi:hypothetical protein
LYCRICDAKSTSGAHKVRTASELGHRLNSKLRSTKAKDNMVETACNAELVMQKTQAART